MPMWKFLVELDKPVINSDFPQNYGTYLPKLSSFNNKDLIRSIKIYWNGINFMKVMCMVDISHHNVLFSISLNSSSTQIMQRSLKSLLLERIPWNQDPWNKGKSDRIEKAFLTSLIVCVQQLVDLFARESNIWKKRVSYWTSIGLRFFSVTHSRKRPFQQT